MAKILKQSSKRYGPISLCEKLVYNGGFKHLTTVIKSWMDVAKIIRQYSERYRSISLCQKLVYDGGISNI